MLDHLNFLIMTSECLMLNCYIYWWQGMESTIRLKVLKIILVIDQHNYVCV